jgi:hypothetical protein
MLDLQIERKLMAEAERKIREAVATNSPGQASSAILQTYTLLSSAAEREAFVSVLAARVAVLAVR